MLKRMLAGLATSALAVTMLSAQAGAPPPGTAPGRGAAAGGGRGSANLPTEEQWASMSPKAKEYVDKAKALAGTDPDLQFDFGIFCKASGGSQNPDRATVGVPNSEPKLDPFPAPSPAQVLGGQRLFDNFYWIGNTGIGAWLVTSNDGYILFDTMNSEDDAKNIILPEMKKLGLDPMKIKYLVFGHNHFDHTGGGEYIQRITGAKAVMHRDDWELYLKSTGRGGGRGRGRGAAPGAEGTATPPPPQPTTPAAPLPKMKRDIDATDGMTLKVGDVTATIFQMTGHTPGSIGMVVPVRYQGRQHPILLVTAGTDVHNREAFVGGYEHIWDEAIKMKAESVMQAHPNTNMNLLARTKYVHDHYPPAKNPLLYGAARTEKYINIMRNCTLARMEILGW
jgi:metallo-beta-lactamase class B